MSKVYMAHCIRDYGSNYANDWKHIVSMVLGREIYDPADSDHKQWKEKGMDYFFTLVEQHGITELVALPTVLKTGEKVITAGVAWEMEQASRMGMWVNLLTTGILNKPLRVLSRADTRAVLDGKL